MQKSLSIFMALLMLFGALTLASCSNPKNNPAQTTDSGETGGEETSENYGTIYSLPKVDYEGYEFIINYRDLANMVTDMSYDAEASDQLSQSKYDRAMAVMSYYNVNIVPNVISGDWCGDMSLTSLAANDTSYDLIMPHSHIAWSTYITEGYALEWTKNMHYNDLDAPWWDQNAHECLSVKNRIYTMLGDSSWMLLGSSVGIVFNKEVLDDCNIEYPYEAVKNKTWTFDKFHEIARDVVEDVNGDGDVELGTDRFGYTTGLFMGPIGFLWTSGSTVTSKDSDDVPFIDLYNDKTISLYTDFFNMMNEKGFNIYDARDSFNTDFHAEFSRGEVVMIDTMISNIEQLRDTDDFGLLPYPMYDESVGEYHSTADAGVHSPIVPYNATNPDRTSMILEALTIEGHNLVIPAFYEVTLKVKYTDDDVDKDMLDIIRDTRTFDFAYYTGSCGPFTVVGTSLFTSKSQFGSYYAANIESAQRSLEDFLEYLDYIE